SWGDPVGWAALDAVLPTGRSRAEVIQARTAELHDEVQAIETQRSQRRGRLRADVLGGATDLATQAAELAGLAEQSVRLTDELHRLDRALATDPVPPPPHAHLRVRPLPEPVEPIARRRFLRIWATISSP